MTRSTIRSDVDATFEMPKDIQRSLDLRKRVWAQWVQRGMPDMVTTLREHPHLLEHQSLLMELVIDEYESQCTSSPSIDLAAHCDRFREFGSGIFNSIRKQLEVQQHLSRQLADVEWPSVGDDLSGFQVVEQLGRGASARVYLCLERELGNRLVVVKVSPLLSFEASILGRLEHPNITPIHSAGVIEGTEFNFLCMPFLGRSTLADLVELAFKDGCPRDASSVIEAANRWNPTHSATPRGESRFGLNIDTYIDRVLQIGIQISSALAFAHERGIVHGDLKPSNVLLTPAGVPMVLDFNLSQDLMEDRRSCGGTLPYMPPEHLRVLHNQLEDGAEPIATVASDVYSFGALLFELLSGKNPIDGLEMSEDPSADAGRILARLESSRPNAVEYNALVSSKLSKVVQRCMAKDPSGRFTSMQDVRRALEDEKRSVRSLVRKARVRPLLFSTFLGLPALAAIGATAYALSLPPSFVRDYEQGLERQREGDPTQAASLFASALDDNPSFSEARFELARSQLAMGQVELAMNGFALLANQEQHHPSVAYLAYCFTLIQSPTTAIVVYERALREGVHTIDVYNNLAVSYLEGSNNLTPTARLQLAESMLQKAISLDSQSEAVHLNLVRVSIRRANRDLKFDPFETWPHARFVLRTSPTNEVVRKYVSIWWTLVVERHMFESKDVQNLPADRAVENSFSREPFDSLHEAMAPTLPAQSSSAMDQSLSRKLNDCLIQPELPF